MFENIGSLVRNPLGIIALFISLIYGMSALLLGATVSSISPDNQNILVHFIVIFPVAILGLFGWLVAGHHNKLYGPGDYRTDESFLSAANRVQPGSIGEKLQQENASAKGSGDALPTEGRPKLAAPSLEKESKEQIDAGVEAPATTDGGQVVLVPSSTSVLYTAQNLALQELENSIGGTLAREVRLPDGTSVDGIIKSSDGNYVIEIKFVSNRKNAVNVAAEGYAAISRARKLKYFPANTKFILVFIIQGMKFNEIALPIRDYFEFENEPQARDLEVRYFPMDYLFAKYNIDGAPGVKRAFL